MNTAILELRNVQKHYHQGSMSLDLFNSVSAMFVQGESYALMGVSGTGKSTLLQLMAGLDRPTSGEVLYKGRALNDFSSYEYQRFLHYDIGLVFQLPYLLRELSVLENVMLKGLIAGNSVERCRDEALYLLDQVGLVAYAHRFPKTLSGGEQQRVALARALMMKPAFLLADEPTAHLDELTRLSIVQLIKSCGKAWSMGIILSTHDKDVAHMLETVIELHEGNLVRYTTISK